MQIHALNQTHLYTLLLGVAFLLAGFMPLSAHAATSSKPSCTLTVSTDGGKAKITKDGDVIVHKGESFEIDWEGKGVKEAEFNGDEVEISDTATFTTAKNASYKFLFRNGSKKVTCEVTAHVVEATTEDVSSGTKPTISGEATGTSKINVAIYKKGSTKKVFEKKNVSVKKGEWEVKLSKALTKGEYEVRLTGDKGYDLNKISSAVLTIGTKNEVTDNGSSKGILSVSSIPLLGGGSTRAGATVPISYLQLRNTGTEAVHVSGFTVKQNGTAAASVITSLSTVDDKGGSRGISVTNPFKNGSALVATDATIEPGAVKLFTIKATLGMSVSIGTNLMLDVTGVESNGTQKGMFPIKGTTWMIGY